MGNYVKICPQCGSTDITIPPGGMDILMTKTDFCNECGNQGMFPEVPAENASTFKEELEKMDRQETEGDGT